MSSTLILSPATTPSNRHPAVIPNNRHPAVILSEAKDLCIAGRRRNPWVPRLRVQSALRWALATALLLTPTPLLHAQGCVQCLDSTRATPPQVQSAYRHAILLLGGTAASIFVTGALLLRKKF